MKKLLLASLLLFSSTAFSQTPAYQTTTFCNAPESSQFDFWVGKWNLTFDDTCHATNTITKKDDGCVVEENFVDAPRKFTGRSWSVFVAKDHKWHQTWVDNQGSFLVLTGGFSDNKMTLSTEVELKDGKPTISRMVFANITKDSFDWNWEKSEDGGKNWKVNWRIHYARRK